MGVKFDQWRKTLCEGMKGVLKPLGFRKQGMTFRKFDGERWLVINVQSSQWNMEHRPMVLYINLGVCYGKDNSRITNSKTGPHSSDCHWFERLPGNGIGCWEVHSDREASEFGSVIARRAISLISEFVQQYPSPNELMVEFNSEGQRLDTQNLEQVPTGVMNAARTVWYEQKTSITNVR